MKTYEPLTGFLMFLVIFSLFCAGAGECELPPPDPIGEEIKIPAV